MSCFHSTVQCVEEVLSTIKRGPEEWATEGGIPPWPLVLLLNYLEQLGCDS